jgi:hypothetical protein
MIWKLWKKSKSNRKKTGKLWKKGKLNSEKIWKIWKKPKLNSENIWQIRTQWYSQHSQALEFSCDLNLFQRIPIAL